MNQFWNKAKVSFALLSALSLFTYTSCSSGGYSDDTLPLIPQPTPTTTVQTETQKAVTVTAKVPKVHGAPIHIGSPEVIGIKDISKPNIV